jgi:hypothetical protein
MPIRTPRQYCPLEIVCSRCPCWQHLRSVVNLSVKEKQWLTKRIREDDREKVNAGRIRIAPMNKNSNKRNVVLQVAEKKAKEISRNKDAARAEVKTIRKKKRNVRNMKALLEP